MTSTRDDEVVVTRVGLVTSGGVGAAVAWDALLEGRGAPAPIQSFAAGLVGRPMGFEVSGWKADRFWRDRKVSYYTRAAQFALKATEECLEGVPGEQREPLGVVVGTQYSTIHNGHRLLDEPDFMTPIKFLSTLPSSTPTNVSLSLGLHGVTTSVSSCAAGLEAVGYARDLIASGHAPALLAGGSEELSADVYAGCLLTGALAAHSEGVSCCGPLLPGSHGLIPGEAGAMVLLEKCHYAEARGRAPLAWIAGRGTAHAPGLAPGYGGGDAVDAGCRAIEAALEEAGLRPDDMDAVFVGANGHPAVDEVERLVLGRIFGSRLPPLVSLKTWLGETFGAFGAVATATATLSLRDGVLPGGQAAKHLGAILIHDFGAEGSHAALVLRHPATMGQSERGA